MMRVNGRGVFRAMGAVVLGMILGAGSGVWADQTRSIAMSGRVVDGAGQPVAGAKVTCHEDTYRQATRDFDGQVVGEGVTQADGAFSFRVASERHGYRHGYAVAKKAGFSLGFADWSMEGDRRSDIVLGEPRTLAGVVVDESGNPIPQAAVSVSALAAGGQMERALSRSVAPKILTVGTDADGRFAFTNLPAGATVELMARKAGRAAVDTFAPQTYQGTGFQYSAGRTDVKLALPPEARIEGLVVDKDTGQRVPGVLLRVMQQGGMRLSTHGAVASEPDGRFRVESLAAGSYELALVVPPPREGMAEWVAMPVPVAVDVGRTREGVRVEVGKGGVLEIQVADADGKAIPNTSIGLEYSGKNLWRGAESDANGLARARLVPGTYRMQRAYAPGYISRQENQAVAIVEGQTQRMRLTMQEMPKVSGVIRDPNGAPLAGATVSVRPSIASHGDTVSGPGGEFTLYWDTSMEPDREIAVSLLVRHPQRNLGTVTGIGKDTRMLDVKLDPTATLVGRVVDAAGKGIAKAKITVLLFVSNWGSALNHDPAETDAEGNFAIDGIILDQRYSVRASADGYGSRQITVRAGETTDNRLATETFILPQADLSVSGQVVDMEGDPLSPVTLRADGEGQPDRISVQTDAEGRFVFPSVCPGPRSRAAQC